MGIGEDFVVGVSCGGYFETKSLPWVDVDASEYVDLFWDGFFGMFGGRVPLPSLEDAYHERFKPHLALLALLEALVCCFSSWKSSMPHSCSSVVVRLDDSVPLSFF